MVKVGIKIKDDKYLMMDGVIVLDGIIMDYSTQRHGLEKKSTHIYEAIAFMNPSCWDLEP
jgi:hypothetical protein